MNKSLTANRLIVLRKQKGLSQEQLANKSGVALRTIQRIEAAQVSAHLQTLSLLAAALDTELENLVVNNEESIQDNDIRKWLILMHVMPLLGSDNGDSIFKELLEVAIADKYTPWKWQSYIPYQLKMRSFRK